MRVLLLLLVCLSCAACRSPAKVARANDALRLEREALLEQVATIEATNAELRAKLVEAGAAADRTGLDAYGVLPEDIVDAMPRVASVAIAGTSGVEFVDDGRAVVRIFVRPLDGRNRFVQAVAVIEARAIGLGEGSAEPSELTGVVLRPTEVRDAYADGLLGPSYRIVLPLDPATLGDAPSVAVAVTLHDLVTGESFEAERLLRVPENTESPEAKPQISSVSPR